MNCILVSDQYIGNMIRRDLLVGFVEFLQDLFTDCGWSPKSADIPIFVSQVQIVLFHKSKYIGIIVMIIIIIDSLVEVITRR